MVTDAISWPYTHRVVVWTSCERGDDAAIALAQEELTEKLNLKIMTEGYKLAMPEERMTSVSDHNSDYFIANKAAVISEVKVELTEVQYLRLRLEEMSAAFVELSREFHELQDSE